MNVWLWLSQKICKSCSMFQNIKPTILCISGQPKNERIPPGVEQHNTASTTPFSDSNQISGKYKY